MRESQAHTAWSETTLLPVADALVAPLPDYRTRLRALRAHADPDVAALALATATAPE